MRMTQGTRMGMRRSAANSCTATEGAERELFAGGLAGLARALHSDGGELRIQLFFLADSQSLELKCTRGARSACPLAIYVFTRSKQRMVRP